MTRYKLEVSFLEYESQQGDGWTKRSVIAESYDKQQYDRFIKRHGKTFDGKTARLYVTETTIKAGWVDWGGIKDGGK